MFTLARFLPRALPLLVVVAMMPAPVPAAAWAAPPSLNGESVSGTGTLDTSGCVVFSGPFSFNVTGGSATGAYTGTFNENGTVTADLAGNATGFTASFSITATSGPQSGDTVAGVKMWAPPPGTALCIEGIALNVNSTYSAIITLPSLERFCDTGTAVTDIGVGGLGHVSESFTSSATTATRMGPTSTCP